MKPPFTLYEFKAKQLNEGNAAYALVPHDSQKKKHSKQNSSAMRPRKPHSSIMKPRLPYKTIIQSVLKSQSCLTNTRMHSTLTPTQTHDSRRSTTTFNSQIPIISTITVTTSPFSAVNPSISLVTLPTDIVQRAIPVNPTSTPLPDATSTASTTLSPQGIAGIILGIVAGMIAIGALLKKRSKRPIPPSSPPIPTPTPSLVLDSVSMQTMEDSAHDTVIRPPLNALGASGFSHYVQASSFAAFENMDSLGQFFQDPLNIPVVQEPALQQSLHDLESRASILSMAIPQDVYSDSGTSPSLVKSQGAAIRLFSFTPPRKTGVHFVDPPINSSLNEFYSYKSDT